MRASFIAVALVGLVAAACGSSSSTPDVVAASAPVVATADVTTAPAQTTASHVKLGFAFTANLLGELEPCG